MTSSRFDVEGGSSPTCSADPSDVFKQEPVVQVSTSMDEMLVSLALLLLLSDHNIFNYDNQDLALQASLSLFQVLEEKKLNCKNSSIRIQHKGLKKELKALKLWTLYAL